MEFRFFPGKLSVFPWWNFIQKYLSYLKIGYVQFQELCGGVVFHKRLLKQDILKDVLLGSLRFLKKNYF